MDEHDRFTKILIDGTNAIDNAITKMNWRLDHGEKKDLAETMDAYTNVYKMCTSGKNGNERLFMVKHLYGKYESAVKERISKKVIPSLENKEGTALVSELAKAWREHKRFTKDLVKIFLSLEYNQRNIQSPPPKPLPDISLARFCDVVWVTFQSEVEKAIRDLIASGWAHEEKPDVPSYAQLSDFVERVEQINNIKLLID